MTPSATVTFVPNWDVEQMKAMSDEELISNYKDIKQHMRLVDPMYLTEICKRNLLSALD